jgi:hypothetical protein
MVMLPDRSEWGKNILWPIMWFVDGSKANEATGSSMLGYSWHSFWLQQYTTVLKALTTGWPKMYLPNLNSIFSAVRDYNLKLC